MATLTTSYTQIAVVTVNTNFKLSLWGKYNSQNIANNTSDITLQLRLQSTNNRQSSWANGSSTINDTNSITIPNSISGNATIILNTYTYTVTHSSTGEYKDKSVKGGFTTSYSPMKGTVTGTITLPTIPRTSTLVSNGGYIGEICPITINRKYSNYTDTIRYSFKGTSGTIRTKTTDTLIDDWIIPTSFYKLIPNDVEGIMTLYIDTYNGETMIGTSQLSVAIKINTELPNTTPTATYTFEETNPKAIALNGTSFAIPILNVSQPKIVVNATPSIESKMKAYYFSDNRNTSEVVNSNSNTCEFTYTKPLGGTILYCDIEDGRWYKNLYEKNIKDVAIPYIIPTIKTFEVERESPISGTLVINANGNYYGGKFNDSSNDNELHIYYRTYDVESDIWSDYVEIPSNEINFDKEKGTYLIYNLTLENITEYNKVYQLEISLTDTIYEDKTSIYQRVTINKGIPTYDAGEHDLNVNGDLTISDVNGNNKINVRDELFSKPLVDYTFQDDTSDYVRFDLDIPKGEWYDVRIEGTSTVSGDIAVNINGISNGYYQSAVYYINTLSSVGELNQISGYRPNYDRFYYAHTLSTVLSLIEARVGLMLNPSNNYYHPMYYWKSKYTFQGGQMISNGNGFVNTNSSSINSISFRNENGKFKKGTNIKITKSRNLNF